MQQAAQQPQLQVNSLHLSGANSQLNRLAQEGLLGNLASVLPQSDGARLASVASCPVTAHPRCKHWPHLGNMAPLSSVSFFGCTMR